MAAAAATAVLLAAAALPLFILLTAAPLPVISLKETAENFSNKYIRKIPTFSYTTLVRSD